MYFIDVVNNPVRELDQLDCGIKAAFFWLGDFYSLLNWDEEALLAYSLAGPCDLSVSASFLLRSSPCLLANEEQLRRAVSKSFFKDIWAESSFYNGNPSKGSILHCSVVTQSVAQKCPSSGTPTADNCSLHGVNNRSLAQGQHDRSTYDLLLIAPSHLETITTPRSTFRA
jgi:hypothetical protein